MKTSRSVRRLPSLNALRAFEAAARHLSFKIAAEELNVSQSAISHQIKALEETLGLLLFTRKPRAVELTRKGQLYYPILMDAFDRIAEGTTLIQEKKSTSLMTVQVYSTFAIRWLLPRLERFQEANSNIKVRIHTSQSNTDFEQDDVDAAIMVGRPNNLTLSYTHLFDAQLFPVCSPAYQEKNGPIQQPSDLANHPLLQVFPSPDDWKNWLSAHQLDQVDPQMSQHLKMESYNDALSSAVQGLGIALGQQPYMTHDLHSGALVELFPEHRIDNPNSWYLVCRQEDGSSTKINKFRTWLSNEIIADHEI